MNSYAQTRKYIAIVIMLAISDVSPCQKMKHVEIASYYDNDTITTILQSQPLYKSQWQPL